MQYGSLAVGSLSFAEDDYGIEQMNITCLVFFGNRDTETVLIEFPLKGVTLL